MAITYVGSTTATGNSASYNLDLTPLGLQEGDLVVVLGSCCSTANYSITGWTQVVRLSSNDTRPVTAGLYYKVMTSSPDTGVTLQGSGSGTFGATGIAYVFRGVDTTTPSDVAGVSVGFTNGSQPDPGSITPVTTGAVVIACGAGAASATTTPTAPSGYSNLAQVSVDPGTANSIAIAMKAWTSGAEDAGAFGSVSGGTSSDAAVAFSWAIRPAPVNTSSFLAFF